MDDEPVVLASVSTAGLPIDPVSRAKKHSYRDILKTSAMIGGSSVINLSIGMIRTKIMAVLLGPAGYGVMGAYILISELASRVAQMGLNASGVRQIAQSEASKDAMRIARTVTALRRTSIVCGLLGAIVLAVFSRPIATLTFGSADHVNSVAWLSLVVFVSVVAGSQSALLQGMRRIGDIARLSIVSGLLSTAIGIPLVYLLGTDGLVPTLVAVATLSLAASWWYSRKITVSQPALSLVDIAQESKMLLKLGIAFMASAMLMVGAAYAVRIIVLRKVGLDAAGVYYAAWTLGGLYIGLVLQALGTDCYPRLVSVAYEDQECNRLVNEQAQVSLLLAVPGVLITLTLAPLVISLFYSAKFSPAVDVLRWICLGMAMRVLTWPIGFIVVAKNKQMLFFAIDLAWTVVNIGLSWWCVEAFGVNGAGIAFFGSYIFHGFLVYPIVRRLSGFRWTAVNVKTATCSFIVVGAVFIGLHVLPPAVSMTFGILATIASSYVSIRILVHLVAPERLPRPIAHFLQLGRLAR
ncbi:MAG: O-antigen translocase [Burkholderiales bacterium]|nr:O-antigen translocase [Burkholderiales bacterium]